MDAQFIQNFGSGGSPSSSVTVTETGISIGTSWQKYTVTKDLASLSGKTLGTDGRHTSYLDLQLEFDDTGTFTFEVAQVQLEYGSTATEFEHRSYGEELALCQRYYQEINTNGRTQSIGVAHRQTTNVVRGSIPTPITFRADPSISFSGTYYVLENDGGSVALTSVSGLYGNGGYVTYTGTATGVAGGCSTVFGYGGSIKIEAEL